MKIEHRLNIKKKIKSKKMKEKQEFGNPRE